jgi:uncharacterized repeat protein (TIGR01451 family)
MKTPIRFLFTLLCAATFGLPTIHAATTYTVQDTGDGAANAANCPGSGCRLRDALAAVVDGDTIDFSVTTPATITLTNGQLVVGNSITITGLGANLLTVDANHNSRVFYISSGKTVTISGLTITNGSSDTGGGIFNDHATLTVTNSTLSGNSASTNGGGIDNDGEFGSATLTVINSTISGNSGLQAGGISNSSKYGSTVLNIRNSTLTGNSGTIGAVWNNGELGGASLEIVNSTISGNGGSSVGGILNSGGFGSATTTIGSTILNAGSGANIANDSGTVNSNGYNLSSDDESTLLNAATDQNSTDPKLGPLQDNGGPTFTHALCTGSGVPDASCTGASPAIDAGKNFTSATTDQRGTGFARTVDLGFPKPTGGDGTDIGAFEVQSLSADLGISLGQDKNIVKQGDKLTYTITVQNFGPDDAGNVVVNDVLSSGTTFVSAMANVGHFTKPPVGQTGVVTWYLGVLANTSQEAAQLTVTVTVRGKTSITDSAAVTSAAFDPNPANNTAMIMTTVAAGGKKK